MKATDWACEITRVANGYVCKYPHCDEDREYIETDVFSDDDDDELKSGEDLLWWIIDHFALGGSRHDAERLRIKREPGDKHPSSDTEEQCP
jgi:hypothetical protein